MTIILETPRLILRPFKDEDLEPFLAYRSDPLISRYQGWELPYTRQMALDFVEEMKNAEPGNRWRWYQFALELRLDGVMIGDCGFHLLEADRRQAEIGFTIAYKYQGFGYGSEAVIRVLDYLFEEMELHRVQATCDPENLSSVRLLERVGFRREGHFMENFWSRDHWTDEYWYATLRREWKKARNI
jgi:RimJ/RimL family protein N-acetyltransferase